MSLALYAMPSYITNSWICRQQKVVKIPENVRWILACDCWLGTGKEGQEGVSCPPSCIILHYTELWATLGEVSMSEVILFSFNSSLLY